MNTQERSVSLSQDPKGRVMADPVDKVRVVGPGDTVVWNFKNDSTRDLIVGIGNFSKPRHDGPWNKPENFNEPREDPFDSGARYVSVAHGGGFGRLECRIKDGVLRPRTYKYDILEQGAEEPILDPEIEIPPP